MKLTWKLKGFDDLSGQELYAIIQLRNEVFVVEQNCVYQDADNKDKSAWHYMGWNGDQLVAYTRILPPHVAFDEVSIGRVVNSPVIRGKGLGKELVQKSLEQVELLYGNVAVRIGAQLYLEKFYNDLGFVKASDMYLEDGIEHIEMIRIDSFS